MILPAMGVISEIFPTFAKQKIFGYKAIAFSSLAIAFVGYLVWGHHMFTSGISDTSRWIFSLLTFIVAVPSGIKVFNWVATLYKGAIEVPPPMLFALSFIFLFSIGGLTGFVVGALATDIHIHDTYFVVAHFHYVMFGGVGIAIFAALLYWFPKMFGRMFRYRPFFISWVFIFVGFNTLYFPMFIMGWLGMPRRYYDYMPEFQIWHQISTVGSWLLATGVFIFFIYFVKSLRAPRGAPDNPWGGTTLEWRVPSPPPAENFIEIPTVTAGPYDHHGEGDA